MKTSMLFLWLCLLCTATYAQTEFAPNNAHWHYGVINSDGADFLSYTHCAVKMDTLIEGHVCSKITTKQYNGSPAATVLPDEYCYTSGDTVFYFNRFFHRFLILYRFDVAKGDTLKLHVPFTVSASPDSFRVVVDSVYLVRIGSLNLRRVRTRPLDHFALDAYTERVGGTSLIGHRQVATTGFILYNRCYGDGDIDTNFTHQECDYLAVNSIAESSIGEDRLLMYPNPATDEICITAAATAQSVYIYDALGKCCFSTVSPQLPLRIPVRQWPAGIYRVRVTNDKGQARIRTFERQ